MTPDTSGGSYFLSSALTPVSADRGLADLRLTEKTLRELRDISTEWSRRERLASERIERRTKLLFHGPPGCGKSVTARALGLELGLPVYVVRFDAVVGAYLGQTALHLRQLFRFAEMTPCVILIDEIDALGKRRGNPLDVGELDRVVIALLQELEHSRPAGLLIATSNIAHRLDDALWRRFDLVLEFPAPGRKALLSFAAKLLRQTRIPSNARIRADLARSHSFADVERLIAAQHRRRALQGD
jgi:SpoVK/Ycf46/Vps4 family AAA+-type ATPase